MAAEGYRRLAGLRVGLVTNPTGILPDLTSTIDALHRATHRVATHTRAVEAAFTEMETLA